MSISNIFGAQPLSSVLYPFMFRCARFVKLCNLQHALCNFKITHMQFANASPKPDHNSNHKPNPDAEPNLDPNSNHNLTLLLTIANCAAHFANCADSKIAHNIIIIQTDNTSTHKITALSVYQLCSLISLTKLRSALYVKCCRQFYGRIQ